MKPLLLTGYGKYQPLHRRCVPARQPHPALLSALASCFALPSSCMDA